jgi:RNA polymerase primary sigma factor
MKKSIIVSSDEIQHYIKDIRKIPVITHERQNEIFKILKSTNTDDKIRESVLSELVTGNLRFVISVAKMYQNQGLDLMDLISEGNIGLIKASEKFDPNNGVKFISYAVWWVKQSIKASLNEYARTIRIPSNLVQESQKLRKKNKTHDENGNEIITSEENYIQNLPYCVGLFNEINEDGDMLIDLIPNKNINSTDYLLNSPDEIRKKVDLMLSVLDEREKTIITKYYGLIGTESNLEDLGDEFGCTKERIRQLRDKAIKKLRNESYDLLNYL